MLSSFILSVVSILQKINFEYLYFLISIYLIFLWVSFSLWVWRDSGKRFESQWLRFIVWFLTTVTFIFGLLLYLLSRPPYKDEDDLWANLEKRYLKYETYGMGECEKCNFDLRPEFMNCPNCGTILREKCASCGNIVDVAWKICPYCAVIRIEEKETVVKRTKLLTPLYKNLVSLYKRIVTKELHLFYIIKTRIVDLEKSIKKETSRFRFEFSKKEVEVTKKKITDGAVKKSNTKNKNSKNDINTSERIIKEFKRLFFIEEKVSSKR